MGQTWVGLVVALGITAFAYGKKRAVRVRLRGRPRAEGEVVAQRKNHRGAGPSPTSYAPVVEFVDADGGQVRGESGSFSKSGKPAVGTKVTVLYDPAEPTRINVVGHDTGEVERWLFGASLVLVGIAVAAVVVSLFQS